MENITGYTPGPWRAEINVADEIWIHGDHVSFIAQVSGPHVRRQINENARLIASAPDMLEALIEVYSAWRHTDNVIDPDADGYEILNKIKTVIERATGRNIEEVIE